jgi:hypothetical protein
MKVFFFKPIKVLDKKQNADCLGECLPWQSVFVCILTHISTLVPSESELIVWSRPRCIKSLVFRIHEKYEVAQEEMQKLLVQKRTEANQKLVTAEYIH